MYRILIADDHPIFRDGLERLLLQKFPDAMTSTVGTYCELEEASDKESPDLFVLDIHFPGFVLSEHIPKLRRKHTQSSVVMVSMSDSPDMIERAMHIGADGFISKSAPPDEIAEHIQKVLDGEVVTVGPVANYTEHSGIVGVAQRLTPRQSEVLRLIALGKSNKEIARELKISPFTAREHASLVFKLLNVSSRSSAAAIAIELGLYSSSLKGNGSE